MVNSGTQIQGPYKPYYNFNKTLLKLLYIDYMYLPVSDGNDNNSNIIKSSNIEEKNVKRKIYINTFLI